MKKTVVVTGGSSGIGKEIAEEFYRRGFDVFTVGKTKDKKDINENIKHFVVDVSNYEDVITINIDLKNNKVLSNDDMIDMVKGSYKDIATDIFNEYIKINNNREVVDAITEEKLSSSVFNNNSEKYIIRIREKLPEVMNIYVENNEVYYLVRKYEINKVCYYTNTDINMGYINKKIGKL